MAMVISVALTDPASGIAPFLTSIMGPVLGGQSPFIFTLVAVGLAVCLGQFANNVVMGVLLIPVVHAFSLENGANPAVSASILIFAIHIAILTPASSPYAAILISNRQWVDPGDVFRYGLIIVAMITVLYIFLGYPLAQIFF